MEGVVSHGVRPSNLAGLEDNQRNMEVLSGGNRYHVPKERPGTHGNLILYEHTRAYLA